MDREDAGNLCAPMCVWHREERENTNSPWEQSEERNGVPHGLYWPNTWICIPTTRTHHICLHTGPRKHANHIDEWANWTSLSATAPCLICPATYTHACSAVPPLRLLSHGNTSPPPFHRAPLRNAGIWFPRWSHLYESPCRWQTLALYWKSYVRQTHFNTRRWVL